MAQRTHLIQVVTESTYNDNITDLLLISSSDLISNVCTGLPLSTSDHNSIECELELISSSDFNSSVAVSEGHLNQLDFNKIDHAGLAASLSITDWQTVFSVNASIDEAWNAFHLYITSLIEQYTPTKLTHYRPHAEHLEQSLPPNIRQLSRDKKAAWKAYKRFNGVEDKLLFKVLAKQMRAKLEVYHREREENILRSASIKTFYAYAKGKIRPPCCMAPIRDASGSIHFSNTDKANTLNNFFHSVFTQDDGNLPNVDKLTDQTMPLPIFEVN